MKLTEGAIYHVFNRGNNRQKIFFDEENYLYFLEGINRYIKPHCDILAWCLMPNHFHLLIHANEASTKILIDGSFKRQQFSQGIKQLLSSYTKAINKRYNRTGSLFQQKTKSVCVSDETSYPLIVFHYIHQNPMSAALVTKMEDWKFSSFSDYTGIRSGKLCNIPLAKALLDLDTKRLYEESYQVVNYNSFTM